MKRFFYILNLIITISCFAKNSENNNIDEAIKNNLLRYSEALSQIKTFYIKDLSYKELIDNSIKGMTSLLDPHSEYLTESEWHNLNDDIAGDFVGIGISTIAENGLLRVISPLDNSPAFKAGIKTNDVIFKINDKLVSTLGVDNSIKNIKGKENTTVKVSIYRPENKKIIELNLTRKRMDNYPVTSKIINKNLLLARIPAFNEKTANELKRTILKNSFDALILDLRNNPGGLLTSAVEICDLFLDKSEVDRDKTKNGTIVSIKGRLKEFNSEFRPHNGQIATNKPIVILINHGSASASEIVSGALKDYHRAIVVGTPSFGKGSVQTILPNKKSALKITTALYHLPNGETIQALGVKPDILVSQIKIAKNDVEKTMYELINEASNTNHIKASKADEKDIMLNGSEINKLAYEDFQLYQAAKIAETMIVSYRK